MRPEDVFLLLFGQVKGIHLLNLYFEAVFWQQVLPNLVLFYKTSLQG